jgi:hypothetical protein
MLLIALVGLLTAGVILAVRQYKAKLVPVPVKEKGEES